MSTDHLNENPFKVLKFPTNPVFSRLDEVVQEIKDNKVQMGLLIYVTNGDIKSSIYHHESATTGDIGMMVMGMEKLKEIILGCVDTENNVK